MTARIEFRSTKELHQFKQLIFDIRYALGLSTYNNAIVEVGQKGQDEVYELVLHFPLTIDQERTIKLILHNGNYGVYWSEIYD